MNLLTDSLSLFQLIVFVVTFLLLEGIYSGAEISLLSADKLALREAADQGSHRAKVALELSGQPEKVLSTTLVMTCACVVTISSLISLYLGQTGVEHTEAWSIALTSPLIVLFGELIPKMVYQRHATRLAPWVAILVNVSYWALLPITRLLSFYTTYISKIIAPLEQLLSSGKRNRRDELRALLSTSQRQSEIKSSERKIIKRILDFKDASAKTAFIPLVKVDAIEDSATIQEALRHFNEHRHSRIPVYSERIDNIIGILAFRDLFSTSDLNGSVRKQMSPAHYVAETQALDDLLVEMRQEHLEMVVVVDEHGGAVGVITFEDIIEEILGEIDDEYDHQSQALYKTVGDAEWIVQAKIEIEAINESLKLDLPQGDYTTLGGFLLQQFGRIPQTGDELFFDTRAGSLKLKIRKASERQIEIVMVELLSPSSKE
jgi:putative hemolysin